MATLTALLAVTLLVVAAGCSRKQSGDGTHAARANDWTVPGVLRMAGERQPDNLNPLLGAQAIDTDLSMFWAAYLFTWNDKNQFVPELATTVPTLDNGGISRDGLRITYHLRRGVKWQDGPPFTAADIVYTWKQVLNPNNGISPLGYDIISSIEAPDAYTLVVHLKHRYAPFVATFFSMSSTAYCILPKHLLERYRDLSKAPFNQLPIGTGPFRVVSNHDGTTVMMAANEGYWRGPPGLKEVRYQFVAGDRAILEGVRSHKIDFYSEASQVHEPSLYGISGTTVYLYPFTRFADIGFNTKRTPLSDVQVRRALAYATDRRKLIELVSHRVNLASDSDQPPFLWAYDGKVKRYSFDPKLAARMLERAGWRRAGGGLRYKAGRTLNLTMVGIAGSSTISQVERLLKQEWQGVGVGLTIKNYASPELYASQASGGIEQSGMFDVSVEEWSNGVDPDDSQLFRCNMTPPRGWNIYHFCDAALDAAEETAISQYELPKRKAAYTEVQRILAQELPVLVIWFQQRQDVVNVDLTNYRPAHAVTPFWNTWAWRM